MVWLELELKITYPRMQLLVKAQLDLKKRTNSLRKNIEDEADGEQQNLPETIVIRMNRFGVS